MKRNRDWADVFVSARYEVKVNASVRWAIGMNLWTQKDFVSGSNFAFLTSRMLVYNSSCRNLHVAAKFRIFEPSKYVEML